MSHPNRAALVIPAHNEARRGFAVLDSAEAAARCGFLVVVVCNGCTDDTASVARSRAGLVVIESAEASKSAALNDGDAACGGVFPRLYVDADVDVSVDALEAIASAVDGITSALAAGPVVQYNGTGAPWLVRRYYRALQELPFLVAARGTRLEGRGVYAVSERGRARFTSFPSVRGDDTFFDRMFDPVEKVIVHDATVTLRLPGTVAELLRAQARAAQSSHEVASWLAAHEPTRIHAGETSPQQSLLARARHHARTGLVRLRLADVVTLAAWATVEACSRSRATLRRARGSETPWR